MIVISNGSPEKFSTFIEKKEWLITEFTHAYERGRDQLEDEIYSAGDWRCDELLSPLSDIQGWLLKIDEDEADFLNEIHDFLKNWTRAIDSLAEITEKTRDWALVRLRGGKEVGDYDLQAPWIDFSGSSEQNLSPSDQSSLHDVSSSSDQSAAKVKQDGEVHTSGLPRAIKVKGQSFNLIEIRPYQKKDGSASKIVAWESKCKVCGRDYEYTSPIVIDKGKFPLTCSAHRGKNSRNP